jgi:hypothetical protein
MKYAVYFGLTVASANGTKYHHCMIFDYDTAVYFSVNQNIFFFLVLYLKSGQRVLSLL